MIQKVESSILGDNGFGLLPKYIMSFGFVIDIYVIIKISVMKRERERQYNCNYLIQSKCRLRRFSILMLKLYYVSKLYRKIRILTTVITKNANTKKLKDAQKYRPDAHRHWASKSRSTTLLRFMMINTQKCLKIYDASNTYTSWYTVYLWMKLHF